jgi:hypothetical protein
MYVWGDEPGIPLGINSRERHTPVFNVQVRLVGEVQLAQSRVGHCLWETDDGVVVNHVAAR